MRVLFFVFCYSNSQVAVPGLPGGSGRFQYGINAIDNYICYDIELFNFPPRDELVYVSPANTGQSEHMPCVSSS